MAEVTPFHGIHYNIEKISNISDVVTPPYDVISDKEQNAFYQRHPNNVVRLDKGKSSKSDTNQDNPHTRAAAHFNDWMKENILVREPAPALYLAAVKFEIEGNAVTRFGLIARVKLEPFEKRIVLPHEKTFSKIKSERLELIKACKANFSQIFSIFSDPNDIIKQLKKSVNHMPAMFDFTDDAGHCHQLWRITDPAIHQKVLDDFKEKKLFIADGHHRYETALNYKKWLKHNNPDFSADHPANYTMMYLCSIQDPGLVILPTNRLLTSVSKDATDGFIDKAKHFFDVKTVSFDPAHLKNVQEKLRNDMTVSPGEHKIGIFIKDRQEYFVLCLKPKMMDTVFGDTIDAPLKGLDVIVLTRLIFIKILGFDDDMLDDSNLIHFTNKDFDTISAITAGTHDMAFLLNPTTNEQVRKIAEQGLIMPRKSTYYFPKAISGQVMRSLNDSHKK